MYLYPTHLLYQAATVHSPLLVLTFSQIINENPSEDNLKGGIIMNDTFYYSKVSGKYSFIFQRNRITTSYLTSE